MRFPWKAPPGFWLGVTRHFVLIAAAAIAFGGSLRGSFHFDDYSLLSARTYAHLLHPLQTRPLTFLTFWLNHYFGGRDPFGYHLVNLLLHIAVVLLLFHVLRRMIGENEATVAAAIFAVHPIQSEAVAYVFERGTLLCTLFCLVSFDQWLRGRRWSAVAWFGVALLAKEECVTFPAVLLLAMVSLGTWESVHWRQLRLMFGLSALAGLRTVIATKLVAGSGAGFTAGIGPFHYLAVQGWAILRYLQLVIVPWGFTIDPDVRLDPAWIYALAWLGLAGLIALACLRFRGLKEGFWAIAGLVLLIPSSSIFPAADLAADHRMYLPMIAFVAIFGLLSKNRHTWISGAVVFCLLILSVLRMEVWKTEKSIWTEAVRRSPRKLRPLIQLSRYSPTDQSLDLLIQAKQLEPNNYDIAAELGLLWMKMGQPVNSLQEFGRALALRPGDPQALSNRGTILAMLHQEAAAKQDFRRALRIDPCLEAARINMERMGEPLPACSTAK